MLLRTLLWMFHPNITDKQLGEISRRQGPRSATKLAVRHWWLPAL